MTETLNRKPQIELPTPTQLRRFAATAMAAANASNKLHKRQGSYEPTFVWVDAKYKFQDGKAEQFERRSGRFARRVLDIVHDNAENGLEKIVPADRWSLRYSELIQDNLYGNEWVGTLKRYAFEWDNWGTIESRCTIMDASAMHKNKIFPTIDDEGSVDTEFTSLNPSVRHAIVGKEHFGELIAGVRSYRATLE
jgi:hypothetical protein